MGPPGPHSTGSMGPGGPILEVNWGPGGPNSGGPHSTVTPIFLHPINLMRSVVKGEGFVAGAVFRVPGNISGNVSMTSHCTVYTLDIKLLKLGNLITMSIKET